MVDFKMKLRLCSDLHIEHWGDYHSHPANNHRDWNSYTFLDKMDDEKEQTLILAGDICMAKYLDRAKPFFDDVSKRFKEVIMVHGNHHHYRFNFLETDQVFKVFLKQYSNITLLENESILRDDVAIFGATLWTNFNKRELHAMAYASYNMSDYMVIEYSPQDHSAHFRFTPELSVLEHEKTLVEMKDFFKNTKNLRKLILTHHMPSRQSCAIQYLGSPLNPAFYSELDEFILKHKPDMWIHGHTHSNCDYEIGTTKVLCNPYGYAHGAENPEYNPNMVIKL